MARKLHIGGQVATPGWEVLDANPGPIVDHVGNAADLSVFPDDTFTEIYASHVIEHFDYKNDLLATLKEWRRVMTPGGLLYISVPDLDVLARLFVDREKYSGQDRYMVMRMIFGGHLDKYDYHLVGLNEEFLVDFLLTAGFNDLRRINGPFGLFRDTSAMMFKDVPISLNLMCRKPLSLRSGARAILRLPLYTIATRRSELPTAAWRYQGAIRGLIRIRNRNCSRRG
jgi:predicted SAM-dependent methyltransferase